VPQANPQPLMIAAGHLVGCISVDTYGKRDTDDPDDPDEDGKETFNAGLLDLYGQPNKQASRVNLKNCNATGEIDAYAKWKLDNCTEITPGRYDAWATAGGPDSTLADLAALVSGDPSDSCYLEVPDAAIKSGTRVCLNKLLTVVETTVRQMVACAAGATKNAIFGGCHPNFVAGLGRTGIAWVFDSEVPAPPGERIDCEGMQKIEEYAGLVYGLNLTTTQFDTVFSTIGSARAGYWRTENFATPDDSRLGDALSFWNWPSYPNDTRDENGDPGHYTAEYVVCVSDGAPHSYYGFNNGEMTFNEWKQFLARKYNDDITPGHSTKNEPLSDVIAFGRDKGQFGFWDIGSITRATFKERRKTYYQTQQEC
jgi:hypothetical protein